MHWVQWVLYSTTAICVGVGIATFLAFGVLVFWAGQDVPFCLVQRINRVLLGLTVGAAAALLSELLIEILGRRYSGDADLKQEETGYTCERDLNTC